MVNVKKVAIFVGGMLFGSAGFKILASKDAKKAVSYTHLDVYKRQVLSALLAWHLPHLARRIGT